MHASPAFETAVVIGAGIGGLLAARVLAEHARQVVLVERDCIGTMPDVPRKGVPQGHHAHAILLSGQHAIEALCPGITRALLDRGAQYGGGTFFTAGGYLHTPDRDASLFVSRAVLEGEIRRAVLRHRAVRLLDGHHADLPQLENGRVVGVRVHPLEGGEPLELGASLVVDASGRASRTPAWLVAGGYAPPAAERIEVGMRYASRYVRREPGDLDGRMFFSVSPSPTQRRACGVLAQEDDRWIVTLIGYFGDQPPLDDAGFLAFARSLPAPEVAALLARAQPLGEIRPYGFAANQRLRYERLRRFPSGLLLLGDALACFSPVYGQGMSVAAMQAIALQRCLARGTTGLERRFFGAAARVIDAPWSITAGNERQMSPGAARGSLVQRLRYRWVQRVLRASHHDAVVAGAFLRVARLLAPPATLLRPALVARVVSRSARARPLPQVART